MASQISTSMNILAIAFLTTGAATNSFMLYEIKNKDNGHEFPFPEINFPAQYMRPKWGSFMDLVFHL